MPRATVLLPVYNGEAYLAEAIESVLGQTFPDFELLVIDDGSKDGSWQILESYAAKDARVRPIRQANIGLAATLNRGLELATGDYIARLDSDDLCEPRRLEAQVRFMDANPEVGLCGAGYRIFGESVKTEDASPRFTDSESLSCGLLFRNQFAHPSVMIRRETIERTGLVYDPEFVAEDYEYWTRLAKVTRLACLPEILIRYRVHREQRTEHVREYALSRLLPLWSRSLKELGFAPTDDDLRRHALIFQPPFSMPEGALEQGHEWLLAIAEANRRRQVYEPTILDEILAWEWSKLCMHAASCGNNASLAYLRSPLAARDGNRYGFGRKLARTYLLRRMRSGASRIKRLVVRPAHS